MSQFLNIQEVIDQSKMEPFTEDKKKIMQVQIFLGDKHVIQQRQVYDIMAFLGDVGGIYGSMMLIGTAIHSLISSEEISSHMLSKYFKVIDHNSVLPAN